MRKNVEKIIKCGDIFCGARENTKIMINLFRLTGHSGDYVCVVEAQIYGFQ